MDLPLVGDMQASAPPVELALSRAGVSGVQKAIRIRRGEQEILMAAEIDCTVDLARGQKGVHMSRFPELFDEAIDEAVLGEGLLVEVLADRIASQIVERQGALRAEVRIVARWPLRRRTPVTDLVTQEMISLIGIAAANGTRSRRVVGVEATGINACPCAQGLVRGARPSDWRTPATTATRSIGSSTSCPSRPTTSADGGRSWSGPARNSTPRRS